MEIIFWSGGLFTRLLSRYIGPYKLAHYIRKKGYQSQVIDFCHVLTTRELFGITEKFISDHTKVLAISTTFLADNIFKFSDTYYARASNKFHKTYQAKLPDNIIETAQMIKDRYPNIKIILGGYMSDRINGENIIDSSIMGYVNASEDIFLEYLQFLGGRKIEPKFQIINPAFGGQERKHYFDSNFKNYNIETDDFLWHKNDVIQSNDTLPLDISRGCIFSCKFCNYPHLGKGKFDYIRGMDKLRNELIYNYENFNVTNYIIIDDTFNDSVFKLENFCNMTKTLPFKINYNAYVRADLCHRFPVMTDLLSESGLFGAYHGLESLHPLASKLVGKAWSGNQAKDYIPELYHNIWNKKIPMHLNFIVGITHDTKESILDTIKWFKENQLHSIKFDQLLLYGPDNNKNKLTILNEFDKNGPKYGYDFFDSDDGIEWKNNNWNNISAYSFSTEMNELVREFIKAPSHISAALLSFGFTKDYIMNTLYKDYPWKPQVLNQEVNLNKDYFFKLQNL